MNFYEVLGVDPDADPTEVRRAYRERARRFHPDVNHHPAAGDQFRVLTRARDVLADPEERRDYDRLGHADYVVQRIDADFPSPEMVPRPAGGSGRAGAVEGPGSSGGSTNRTQHGAESSTDTGDDPSSARKVRTAGGPSAGSGAADGAATDGTHQERPREDDSATGEARTADGPRRRADGNAGSTVHTVPPTPGFSGKSGGSGSSGVSRPSVGSQPSVGSPTRGRSRPRGPQRVSGTPPSTAWGQQPVGAVVLDHLAASTRWIGVVVAAGSYFAGLAGYLGTHRAGLDALAAALSSSEPVAVAGALRGDRYAVPYLAAYTADGGLLDGGVPSDAAMLLAGVVLLPVALALAVAELRRATTWRPSWLYVVGGLGPVAAVALPFVVSHSRDSGPVAAVPLLADVLLLVVLPVIVVASFLLTRLLVVLPLRRREHLGAP